MPSYFFIVFLIFLAFSACINARDICEPNKSEEEIIQEASKYFRLKPGLLCAVRKHEAGTAGKCSSLNKNGSRDCGPMQISSKSPWVKELRKRGISYHAVIMNACVNIWAGAWILAMELDQAKSFWDGVGHYHSRTAKFKNRYIKKVYNKWVSDCST